MSRVPRLLSGQNLASLPLTPAESHLVSQIDGTVSELALAFVTALLPGQVAATLDRLHRLGVIDFVSGASPAASPPQQPLSPSRTSAVPATMGTSALYDAFELEEQADLDI